MKGHMFACSRGNLHNTQPRAEIPTLDRLEVGGNQNNGQEGKEKE